MLNTFKSTLNTRVLLTCLFLLIMGISAGIFFAGIIPDTEKTYLLSAIQSPDVQFIPTIIMNSAVLALIILAGFTVYGFPLAPLILFLRSFAVGFCDCLLLYNMGSDNIISFIFSFMLLQLFFCSLYLLTASAVVSYALNRLHRS